MQPDLLTWTPPEPQGSTYIPERDGKRLRGQALRVFNAMKHGDWWTLSRLSLVTNDPEASVSARTRGFRNAGYTVETEYVERGLHRYRLIINREAA